MVAASEFVVGVTIKSVLLFLWLADQSFKQFEHLAFLVIQVITAKSWTKNWFEPVFIFLSLDVLNFIKYWITKLANLTLLTNCDALL